MYSNFELYLYLTSGHPSTAQQIADKLRDTGVFGAVDWTFSDEDDLFAYVLTKEVDGQIYLPVSTNGIVRLEADFQTFLTRFATDNGIDMTVYTAEQELLFLVEQPDSDIDDGFSEDASDSSGHLNESDEEEDDLQDSQPDKIAFIVYGTEGSPTRSNLSHPKTLANALAFEMKGPVTVVPAVSSTIDPAIIQKRTTASEWVEGPLIAYAVDGYAKRPAWMDRKPVLAISGGESPALRWYSSAPSDRIRDNLLSATIPAGVWALEATNDLQPSATPIAPASLPTHADPEFVAVHEQQGLMVEAIVRQYLDDDADRTSAQAMCAALGLDDARTARLVDLLNESERAVSITEVTDILGLPTWIERVLSGRVDPQTLPQAVHVAKGSTLGMLGLGTLTRRPSGSAIADKMRQLDFDRPVLALLIELIMVAGGIALLTLTLQHVGIFDNSRVRGLGYAISAWLLIDGIASLVVWTKIRLKNRITGR